MMNYPEQPTRPLKRLPMAHIVTVTGKLSVKGGYFSFLQNLGHKGFCDCDYVLFVLVSPN